MDMLNPENIKKSGPYEQRGCLSLTHHARSSVEVRQSRWQNEKVFRSGQKTYRLDAQIIPPALDRPLRGHHYMKKCKIYRHANHPV
jgi:hypothetical protein